MGITDPAEFQKVAKDYCKEMAVEMMLPAYMRIFSRINKRVDMQKEAFARLTKKRDMISHVLKLTLEDEEIVDMFKHSFSTDDSAGKVSPDLSTDKRNAGNAAFQKKKDKEALDLYTEAVFAADVVTEAGTKDCALGLANRSAVFMKMKKYEECLDDIETSILMKYPENMLYKLVDRKAKCLAALGDAEQAKKCYNRVILLLPQSGLDETKQATWKKETNAEIAKLKQAKSVPWKPKRKDHDISQLLPSPNKTVPQLSSAVELAYNPLVGRHGVATRDIEAGEVLMVDPGLASHLLCSTRLTNCCHCTLRLLDMTTAKPSPLTRTARFCSFPCIQEAMASYHPVEAKINIQKMFWNKKEGKFEELSGNILLSYRCITQKPLNFFLDHEADYDKVDDNFGVEFSDENDKLVWNDYRNIINLEAHRDRKTKDELLSLTIRSVIFVILLRYGGYFGQKETPYGAALSKAEATIADIVFAIQEGIQYNLHQVCGVISDSTLTGITAPKTVEFGSALFPTLLLLNHSCDANTLRINIDGAKVSC